MATAAAGNLQLDFYFVVKVLTLRFLQVGVLVLVIVACLVFLYKSLKVRTRHAVRESMHRTYVVYE